MEECVCVCVCVGGGGGGGGLGRSVKSLEWEVGDRVDEHIMEEMRKWWQRRKELVYSGSPHEPGPL